MQALRSHGVRIGTGETVDAGLAVEALGLTDREHLREGLAAALLHSEGQRSVFDPVFDLYFPRSVGAPQDTRHEPGAGRPWQDSDTADLRERLAAALAANDQELLDQLAAEAVDGLGGYGTANGAGGSGGSGGSGPSDRSDGWSSHQTLARLRPETLLARILAGIRAGLLGEDEFTDRLQADEIRRRIQAFRGRVGAEARRRVAERRGADEIARRAIAPTADRVDFLIAGRAQLDELRRAVQPLARKLATRLAAHAAPGRARADRPAPHAPWVPVDGRRPDAARAAPPCGPRVPNSSSCATCPARSRVSPTSRCCWCRHCTTSSARCGCSPSSTASTR